jgi:hypothetical protein
MCPVWMSKLLRATLIVKRKTSISGELWAAFTAVGAASKLVPIAIFPLAQPKHLRGVECELAGSNVSSCEGLRMPAHDGGAACTGAGVRKPPMEETAGGGRGCRGLGYGDLSAADEVSEWSRGAPASRQAGGWWKGCWLSGGSR